jgi:hypothetical protein
MAEADAPPICADCGDEITEDERTVSERQSGPGEIDRYHLECWSDG